MVQLLLQHGADPTQISNGVAPLHIAAANGIVPLCEMLIQFGASVNTVRSPYMCLPVSQIT
jgi:ankyrin repeat protein